MGVPRLVIASSALFSIRYALMHRQVIARGVWMKSDAQADGLIGLDWGTSSLRAYRIDDAGRVVETRERPWGIRQLPPGGFDAALADITAHWPALPRLACGMLGSHHGWCEVAYVEQPADAAQLASRLGCVKTSDDQRVHIVPGLHGARGPEVMRGEETQLVGALSQDADPTARSTWILPGTHSKWVNMRGHTIDDFATFMTGECYALLREHSILGDAAQGADDDPEAFVRGVMAARDSRTQGVFSRLFSARTLMLDGDLAPQSVADYLSGLLIGEEWRSALASDRFDVSRPIRLIGSDALCARYRRAAECFDIDRRTRGAGRAARAMADRSLPG
jgi:2-dehydro-3-deoxygalactonokinase